MRTTNDHATVSGAGVGPVLWQEGFDSLMCRIAGRFSRVEPRRRVRRFVSGLLADLPRKNCWTLAEHAGDTTPDGMRHLLHRAKWDADAIRDDIRAYVVDHLHDTEAVLVVDETGDLMRASGVGRLGAGRPGLRRPTSAGARRVPPSIRSASAAIDDHPVEHRPDHPAACGSGGDGHPSDIRSERVALRRGARRDGRSSAPQPIAGEVLP